MEQIRLTTKDGKTIAADFYPAEGEKYAILLHMMPATKESWAGFAAALAGRGVASIAIDERGHGASEGGPGGYKEFTEAEQQAKILDARAAWEELKRRGAVVEKTVVVGASIGANLAIQMAVEARMPAAVALSPGVDYRGVTTDDKIGKLADEQRVLLVASEEDETSFKSILKLGELKPDQVELVKKSGIGHGTTMFENDPELFDYVVNWVAEKL
ncbi:MAG: alpha/beta fold hydrolase [bacterium]